MYAGTSGVAEFLAQAQELLRRLAGAALVDSPGFDLTQGRAGAIIAFLALHAETGDSWFLEEATRLGNDLLATAERSDGAWSWRAPDGVHRANLTGLSHGTAGVALALSELAFASGERRFLDAGAGALRYERGWFDHDARNWRDLRDEPRGAKQGSGPKRFATHWCHGAPGIALSRLRIYELFEDGGLRGEAEVALSTTREAVASASWPGRDFSLCHGLAGNADVLLEGTRVLGKGGDHPAAAVPQALADFGARQYLTEGGGSWPCGAGGGATPGLMIGLAGIGHFYLRLHDADVDRLRLGALVRLLQAEGSSTARDRGVRGLEVEHVGSCRISLRLDLQPAGESRRRKGARGQDQVRRRVGAVLGGAELEAFEPGLHPALEEPHPFVGPGATSVEWRHECVVAFALEVKEQAIRVVDDPVVVRQVDLHAHVRAISRAEQRPDVQHEDRRAHDEPSTFHVSQSRSGSSPSYAVPSWPNLGSTLGLVSAAVRPSAGFPRPVSSREGSPLVRRLALC